jgi:hypothetical protein
LRRAIVLDLNLVVTTALRVGLLTMIVRDAKAIARDWVSENAGAVPGYRGAFLHGSITWLSEHATLSPTSDLDVVVVVNESRILDKPGKLVFRDVLLDVSFLSSTELESPETVLSNSHLAGSFRAPSVISDPSRWLTDLNTAMSRDFAKRHWVTRRCEHAKGKVLQNLDSLDQTKPMHDQVVSWLFATGVTTHILLTAGLRNPTVRQRYIAVRQLLHDYQRLPFYDELLELLGCANMSRERVEVHLDALTSAFDSAKSIVKTPFLFAADISDLGRSIAIDGSRELVGRGDHREAVFWMAATYSRCQQIFYADAPAKTRDTFTPGYMALLADLGITSHADLNRRCDEVRAFLPLVWEEAEAIMQANPEIED